MRKELKYQVVEELKEQFERASFFYIADSSELSVAEINDFRRKCFEKGISVRVAKNTLVRKALEAVQSDDKDYSGLYDTLKGPTSLLFTETANAPAKIIKEFRKTKEKPVLKAAYIDSSIYLGDEVLEQLASLKSKEELIGDIILLLQSPAKNVISALGSGGSKLAGIIKTLQERPEA